MIQHNGQTSPFSKVARDVRHVAHDVVELSELQAGLLKTELQGWWKQFILPVSLIAVASVIAACSVVVLLMSAGHGIAAWAEISLALGLLCAGGGAVLIAGVVGGIGWALLKSARSPCPESTREFSRNLRWIKTVLKDAGRAESRQTLREEMWN